MKKLFALLLAVLLTAGLCACKKDSATNDLDKYKQDEKIITSWTNDEGETFYFDSIDSETVMLVSYTGPDTVHALTIPATLNGKAVASIGDMAFYNCSSIASVTFPASLTEIGNYAFACCASITQVSIPETVVTIGKGAFSACTALTTANFSSSNQLTEIKDFLFYKCTSLAEITIPGTVLVVGNGAFYGCTSLTAVTISEGVQVLGSQSFQNCEKLASLTLPGSVTTIGSYSFSGCAALCRDKVTCPADSASSLYIDSLKLPATANEE